MILVDLNFCFQISQSPKLLTNGFRNQASNFSVTGRSSTLWGPIVRFQKNQTTSIFKQFIGFSLSRWVPFWMSQLYKKATIWSMGIISELGYIYIFLVFFYRALIYFLCLVSCTWNCMHFQIFKAFGGYWELICRYQIANIPKTMNYIIPKVGQMTVYFEALPIMRETYWPYKEKGKIN